MSPAVVLTDHSTYEVAERSSYGNGNVEDGEHAVALLGWIEVRKQSGSEDSEARLTDAQRGMAKVQRVVGVDGCSEEVDATPEQRRDDDHRFAREAIAQPSRDRRGDHIRDHEPEGEGS